MKRLFILLAFFLCVQLNAGPPPLKPSNFKYAGSFRPPNDGSFVPVGQAFCYVPGRGTLYLGAAQSSKRVAEITIPQPKSVPITWTAPTAAPYTQIPEASYVTPLMDPTRGTEVLVGGYAGNRNLRGLAVVQRNGSLQVAWSCWVFYNVSAADYPGWGFAPLLHQAGAGEGPWTGAGSYAADQCNVRGTNYQVQIPAGRLGGYDMLTGGHGQGQAAGGNGPCLYAYKFPAWDLTVPTGKLTAKTIAEYTTSFPAQGYTQADIWNGIAWVKSGTQESVLIAGRKGLGPVFYGEPTGRCEGAKGWHADPYEPQLLIYSVDTLESAFAGTLSPHDVKYTAMSLAPFMWPTCHGRITGLAWDGSKYLYLLQTGAFVGSGGVWYGVIHRIEVVPDAVTPAALPLAAASGLRVQ